MNLNSSHKNHKCYVYLETPMLTHLNVNSGAKQNPGQHSSSLYMERTKQVTAIYFLLLLAGQKKQMSSSSFCLCVEKKVISVTRNVMLYCSHTVQFKISELHHNTVALRRERLQMLHFCHWHICSVFYEKHPSPLCKSGLFIPRHKKE